MSPRVFLPCLLAGIVLVAVPGVSSARAPHEVDSVAERVEADYRPDAPNQEGVGHAFTYQGSLTEAGAPANGEFSMQFGLYDVASGGTPINDVIEMHNVVVVNGQFTADLSYGNPFDYKAFWLEIQVRASGASDYTILTPRQRLTPTPYALASLNSWNLTGNDISDPSQQFVGTTNSQPLVFRVGNQEQMRLDPVGRVGIGIESPQASLDVSSGAARVAVMGTNPAGGVLGRLGAFGCGAGAGVMGCGGGVGMGVIGRSELSTGVRGESVSGRGVEGNSESGIGVLGNSATRGVIGTLASTSCAGSYAVGGCAGNTAADGVYGFSAVGAALHAKTESGALFVGDTGGTRVVRIGADGKGYFNGGTQTGGADYAESMPVGEGADGLEPGDVLVLDPAAGGSVRMSIEAVSRMIAGVYSTRPSMLAVGEHGIDSTLEGEVPVALLGRVPTKVTTENGPIEIGDLLVTSSLAGHAMKALPRMVDGIEIYPTGAILGKALGSLKSGTGMIEVLVTLR